MPTHVLDRRAALPCLLLAWVCCLTLLALGAGSALADTMALSVAPEAVQELTGQVTYTASSEEATYAVVYANNPGVPCAADPDADVGQMLTPTHFLEGGNIGEASSSANWTPKSTGLYTRSRRALGSNRCVLGGRRA
jgi:hypothetical protein